MKGNFTVCVQWKLPLGRLGAFSICQGWPELRGDAHPFFPCCEDGGDGSTASSLSEQGMQQWSQRGKGLTGEMTRGAILYCPSLGSKLGPASIDSARSPMSGTLWALDSPCSALGEGGRG